MIKKLLTYGASELLTRLAPILTSFLLAKKLGPEEFGHLALVLIVNEILYIVISNNIQATLRVNFFKFEKYELYSEIVNNINFSFYTAMGILSFSVIYYLGTGESYAVFLVLIAFTRTISQLNLALFQCNKVSLSYFIVQLMYILVFFLLLYFVLELGVTGWFIAMLGGVIVQAFIGVYYLKKQDLFDFSVLKLVKPNRKSVFFGLSFMPQAIGWWSKNGVDRYLITTNYGLIALGYYALSYQFSSALIMVVSVINLTIVPEINGHLKSGGVNHVNRLYVVAFFIITLASVFLYLISVWVIKYFYPEYIQSLCHLGLIFFVVTFQCFSLIIMNELYFSGKSNMVAKVVLSVFVAQGMVNYFLASSFSLIFVIYSSLLFNIVLFIIISIEIAKNRALINP